MLDSASASKKETVQLTDVAAFLGTEKSAPYQWAKRSTPNPRTAVGLALFDACKGDPKRISSQMRQSVIELATDWLTTCGHHLQDDQINTLLNEWLGSKRETLLSPLPDLSKAQSYEHSLADIARAYDDLYSRAVRKPDPAVQWRLTLNRLSQVDGTAETANWLERCEQGRAATYFASEIAALPTSAASARAMFWFAVEMVGNRHVQKCDVFIDPLDTSDTSNVGSVIAEFYSELSPTVAQKCSFWLKEKSRGRLPPLSVWAFTDIRYRGCFGRLLIPVDNDNRDTLDDVHQLDSYISGGKPGGGQDQLWRFHSTPLSLSHAIEQMRHRGVSYDPGSREFKPTELSAWRKFGE